VQADVRQFLLTGGLGLAEHDLEVELETQLGDRRRIDIEVGQTVIEVKRDLRSEAVARAAKVQLAGYVATRSRQTGQRYVGVLTDGVEWRAYQLHDGELNESTRHTLNVAKPDRTLLLSWLEGVLATRQGIPPTPEEIAAQLGAASASYAVDRATLAALYAEHRQLPTVQLKRELWASLLRTAQGTQFTDDDALFLEHTLLVNSADVIAHLVVGLEVTNLQPADLLGGQRFDLAGLYGVVERDFFDWVLEVPGGAAFVRTLARRLARFEWSAVEHDVLKVLYESIIGSQTRKRLGEYYTPDWLAEHMVANTITTPLQQRVLDPACGSGTFLFYAVRRYLTAAIEAGRPLAQALKGLTNHVLGVDLHPVAVALARVTYLLAIGTDRLLDPQRGPITVPIYLGDSVQWQQRLDLLTDGHLVVPTRTTGQSCDAELRFPDWMLADAAGFDELVTALADQAGKPRDHDQAPRLPAGLVDRLAISEADRPVIEESFRVMCRLHDEGRDHIWSYYVRNLARPVWLARPENRVDVLVGNPPWLSYRHMPADMQAAFRLMSQERHLWHGREVATHQDLSALFITRSIQQYLADGGTFGFVVPNAVLDRDYFAGFRAGHYPDATEPVTVEFFTSWDLRRLRPHFFPRGSAVVFGRRSAKASPPPSAEVWSGKLPQGADGWSMVKDYITRRAGTLSVADPSGSPYAARFAQGATIVPRVLFMVSPQQSGPLGLAAGRKQVRSARSSTEKKPWKDLPSQNGVVETEFIRPVLLGSSVLPYWVLPPAHAVLPLEGNTLLDGNHPHLDRYPGLADWWRRVEEQWKGYRSSERLTLVERLDFRRGLSGQLPVPALRLLYGASGMHVSAALIEDPRALLEHKLYWGTVTSREEGLYLCAILNSPVLTEIVRPLMSYGKDERDIDKHLWKLPIPGYDETNPQHRDLADLGQACIEHVKTLDLDEGGYFVTLRRRIRSALAAYPPAIEANTIVVTLLARASDPSAPDPLVPMQRRGDELTHEVDPVGDTTSVAARKTQS
jgi:SAM-dependent methyltransferase